MSTDLTDLHDELRSVARDLLAGSSDWARMVDAGWVGLEVPESLDGAGATFAEVAVVLEELGRAAVPSPYLGTGVLGVGALLGAPDGAELLRAVSGGTRVAVAVTAGGDDATVVPAFRLDGGRVTGRAAFVADAPEAEHLLLLALDGTSPVLVRVDPADVAIQPQPVLDETRRFATVSADVAAGDVWAFEGDPQSLLDRGAVALACDSMGLAASMLDATVAYAKVRRQFDQPIGSFQSVKHQCADALVQLTIGRELLTAAVGAIATGAPDADLAAARAKAYVGQAAVDVVGTALQLHGGIGYTWESGIHVHLKRATLNRSLLGSPAAHRRRIAASLRPVG